MAVHLVCEGFRQGLDERVLDAIVIQAHNLPVLTAPSGGASGLGAVRAYLEGRAANDVGVVVEDRNHRPLAVASATWANQGGRAFIWRRHAIENYLLHPRVVLALFEDLRPLSGQAWAARLPASEAEVDALLSSLASPLLADHAAEVLREELVHQINGAGSVSFSLPRPTPPPGGHVAGRTQWLAALLQEITRLCQTCTTVCGLPQLHAAAIEDRYNALLTQYESPAFLTTGDYIRDMGGHELLAALSRHLHGLGARARLSQQVLADELLRALARIYQPNTLFQPDDFADLAAVLSRY